MSAQLELWHRVQAFLFHEARLLDERRLDEWLELYSPEAEYWVPYAWGQETPKEHVSLFYETVALLRMRVDRLQGDLSPLAWPPARVNHYLSNVTVDDGLIARAYLLFTEYRRDEQRWLAGRCTWKLLATGERFLIASKRVDLLNADQDGGHLRFAIPF
jgi:benzoate/toluate 1,2-dioxygenase beta subunit